MVDKLTIVGLSQKTPAPTIEQRKRGEKEGASDLRGQVATPTECKTNKTFPSKQKIKRLICKVFHSKHLNI